MSIWNNLAQVLQSEMILCEIICVYRPKNYLIKMLLLQATLASISYVGRLMLMCDKYL